MLRPFRYVALSLLATMATPSHAADPSTAAAPPAWQDGASVYLTNQQQLAGSETAAPSATIQQVSHSSPDPTSFLAPQEAPTPSTGDDIHRRLAPPSAASHQTSAAKPLGQAESAGTSSPRGGDFGLPLDSLYTMLTALAIVIGTFLACAWLLKRGAARKAAALLPADVVSVLGRVPLAARQFADLLRVGNKLVLITLTPTGATTLTEVIDPVEVDRLVGLCQQANPHSTTKAFEQVFQQMSLEPARGGFLGDESPLPSLQSTMEAFRAQRGDAQHA